MKLFFSLLAMIALASASVSAQNLSPEEQQQLVEENKALKEHVKNLENPTVDASVMEKLQKGQKHLDESNKFLEELDKEN